MIKKFIPSLILCGSIKEEKGMYLIAIIGTMLGIVLGFILGQISRK